MIIKFFSVENFRSIIKAEKLPLSSLSILIGPNNEGKTNLLQGLVLVLQYLEGTHPLNKRIFISSRRRMNRENYLWERDFPLNLQESNSNGRTHFSIEFELNKKEKSDLKKSIHENLEGNLLIHLTFSKSNEVKFDARDSYKKRKKIPLEKVFTFITKRISVQYIGAIRTSSQTLEVINDMISEEMRNLRRDKEYRELMEKIEAKQKPIIDNLSKSLTESISNFLPDVKKIEIDKGFRRIGTNYSSTDLIVDDGTKTALELKGDGIKSLLAISVIQHVAKENALKKNILLAIEEPEAHLHPKAIHAFRKVLEDISKENQIIITTHSPLLVNRSKIRDNLLISKSKVNPANNINEIRDLLGVNISDNLIHSNLVIITEGEDDTKILKKWLSEKSTKISELIENGEIVFDSLSGVTNLSYKLTHWKGLLCDTFVFIDNDQCANDSLEKARRNGLIENKFTIVTSIPNMKESEMEDLIDLSTYKEEFFKEFGVNLEGSFFRNNKKKWSSRLGDTFENQGKNWSESVKNECKIYLSNLIITKNDTLKKSSFLLIDSMIKLIENYFKEKKEK